MRMDPNDAKVIAARNLTKGVTLDDLQEVARDYGALADFVEAQIERIQAATQLNAPLLVVLEPPRALRPHIEQPLPSSEQSSRAGTDS
jgi:hypothetical protein